MPNEDIPSVDVTQDKYAPTAWSKQENFVDLTCPSGQLCKVSRPGVEGLIKQGLLNKLDSLTGLVDAKHIKRVKGGKTKDIDIQSLLEDPESLGNILDTMNAVVVSVVQEPQLTLSTKDVNKIHINNVDVDDRAFIFQFATGGTGDLETFRKQRDKLTRSMEPKQAISKKAQ